MRDPDEWEERIKADFQSHPGSWRPDPENWFREGWFAGYNARNERDSLALALMRSLSINPLIPEGLRTMMKEELDR